MENKDKIIELYSKLKSVWKVGENLGYSGQFIHKYLKDKGINTSKNVEFTSEQEKELIQLYNSFNYGDGKIDDFCIKHKKTRANVSRKARKLGLTSRNRKGSLENNNKLSMRAKDWHLINEHPRGMMGKTHTEENKKVFSINSKKMWGNKDSYLNSQEYRQILSDRASKMQNDNVMRSRYSRGKQGTYNINGKNIFFRSLWEANYAIYLDFLVKNKDIVKWEFEVDTFWFDKIKRGVRSYKPDFKVYENNGQICYHEVKGWMDDKSKTKLNRMKIYHKEIKINLIEQKQYKEIIGKLKGLLTFY